MSNKDKVKEVSFSKLEKLIKSQTKQPTTITYNISETETIEIQVKPILSLEETILFTNSVVEGCFVDVDVLDENNEITGKIETLYVPTYRSLWLGKNILDFYTNCKSDDNLTRLSQLLTQTDMITKVLEKVDGSQYYTLTDAIDEGIEFKKQQILSNKTSKLDGLIDNLNKIVLGLANKADGFDLSVIAPYIPAISNAIKDGTFDMESLAKAVIKVKNEQSDAVSDSDNSVDDNTNTITALPTVNLADKDTVEY